MSEDPTPRPRRYLSGIQPSGQLHLGNYFGAIRQFVDNQIVDNSFYFIANYHALTTVHDAAELRAHTFHVAATYLACGVDPETSVFFRQTDVPEVTELMWLLLNSIRSSRLELAHSYKDKIAKGIEPTGGLFAYPALMAADILAYDSTVVPVGKDQIQHLELTRDMATSFNHRYQKPVFVIPEAEMAKGAAVVPGIDGAKMSKSYDNHVPIMATGKPLKKRVMSIVTDSAGVEDKKDPTTCTVYQLYSLMADDSEREALAEKYRAGGLGYGEAKKALLEKIETYFADARTRYAHFMARPDDVEDILRAGGKKARAVARAVTDRAREACGLA